MKAKEEKEKGFITYPTHRVLGVLDDPELIYTTLAELEDNGFLESDIEVIHDALELDVTGEKHGFWGKIVRSFQEYGAEGHYLHRYEKELNDGHLLLTVKAPNVKTKQLAESILQANGAHRITYFGLWMIEELHGQNVKISEVKSYGFRRELKTSFDETLTNVREALKREGFEILTEVDVSEGLYDRLGIDFRRYSILGAYHLPLAHRALQQDLDVGMLLPCNIAVYELNKGSAVMAIDAAKMLSLTENSEFINTAKSVNEKLRSALVSV